MLIRVFRHKGFMLTMGFILLIALIGILAPFIAPHDPYETDILNKFSLEFPLGTDHLSRCILSRMIYGIRPTLGLATLTMLGTISKGAAMGLDVRNVILANVFIKWAWYARMIRAGVMQHKDKNFIRFSRVIGNNEMFILTKHMLPSIASEMAVLASLDIGWAIINISTLSFLGLGVQAPTPEWGAMLNEAKNVLTTNPIQMLAPGIAIVVLVTAFNFLGDVLRDALDPKEEL